MNLSKYRTSDIETLRTNSLLSLLPENGGSLLDIGTRDGFHSLMLTHRFTRISALDITLPKISHDQITNFAGDVCNLPFDDDTFDAVLCAEVLEHIPPSLLSKACDEVARVTKGYAVVGVPYKQDIRIARSTCQTCGLHNPPWGHVNAFDEERLETLFSPSMTLSKIDFIEKEHYYTNRFAVALLDFIKNPYGTYSQEEPCIHCGSNLIKPEKLNFFQIIVLRTANFINFLQSKIHKQKYNWIHIQLEKK